MTTKKRLYSFDETFLEAFEKLIPEGKRSQFIQNTISDKLGISVIVTKTYRIDKRKVQPSTDKKVSEDVPEKDMKMDRILSFHIKK